MSEPRLAVTTSGKQSAALEAEARAAAAAEGLRFIERRPGAARGSLFGPSVEALVVFEVNRISLVDAANGQGGPRTAGHQGVLRFAAGLAHLRIQQLERGATSDRLVEVAGLRRGERVLDCTLGLAADAQVAAWAVGPEGHVTGLESSVALCLLARHGLGRLRRPPHAARIDVQRIEAQRFLQAQPAGAFDVVLLDPMFDHPRKASPAFELLRRYADHTPLTPALLADARRVAKRVAVVKAAGGSGELERLGITPLPGRRGARVEWGVAEGLRP